MTDILREVFGIFNKRYKDMGDGTHAETIYMGDGVVLSEADKAAIDGLAICRWVNDKAGVHAAPTVLTDAKAGNQPGIYYDLSPGEVVMVSQICVELETASDSVDFELGYTTGAAGTGTFVPISPKFHIYSGAANSGFIGISRELVPKGRVRYADGARSITYRVQTNDAGATITVTWHGYSRG